MNRQRNEKLLHARYDSQHRRYIIIIIIIILHFSQTQVYAFAAWNSISSSDAYKFEHIQQSLYLFVITVFSLT